MKIQSYKELDVWKKGIEIVDVVYEMTREFPSEERFGSAAQMQRSAVSIPSNIAEGFARQHTKEYQQFCYIALGSCAELALSLALFPLSLFEGVGGVWVAPRIYPLILTFSPKGGEGMVQKSAKLEESYQEVEILTMSHDPQIPIHESRSTIHESRSTIHERRSLPRGFTLIELMVASVLFSIAALAISSLFAAGLQMWRRVNDQRPTEQAALAMADMVERREMGRKFAPLKSEEEEPKENEWIFTGLVTGKSGLREIGEVRYQINSGGKLLRQERTYAQIVRGEEGRSTEIGERFETLKVEDLYFDRLRGEFQTEPVLGETSFTEVPEPDAVRIQLQYKAPDDKKQTLVRILRV